MKSIEYLSGFEDNVLNKINKVIINKCMSEVKESDQKEILGIEIQYFYDGEAIDLGFCLNIFIDDSNKISGGEGYKIYQSFIQDNKELASRLRIIFDMCIKQKVYLGHALKVLGERIVESIRNIDWSSITNIEECFYIELMEND